MKILLVIGAAIIAAAVLLIIIVLIVGSRLPETHTASRSVRFRQSPEDVYAVVRNFAASSEWRPDVRNVEIETPENGKVQFREEGSNGVVNYQLEEDVPNRRLVTRIMDRDLGYAGSWTYEFSPSPEGTLVTITENGEVTNIFFRFMSRYVFGHGSTIDTYLKALADRLGETANPE